jgi:hypothetical protein
MAHQSFILALTALVQSAGRTCVPLISLLPDLDAYVPVKHAAS